MRIDITNADIMNARDTRVYIHDDFDFRLQFDRDEKRLTVSARDSWLHSGMDYTIVFHNVIGFEMSSCDYWGSSPHANAFYYAKDDPRLLRRLCEVEKNDYVDIPDPDKGFFETGIEFISGDCLRVVCEYIDFNKNE